jgi:hypothetical protein
MDHKRERYEGVDWIHLVQDMNKLLDPVITVINIRFP